LLFPEFRRPKTHRTASPFKLAQVHTRPKAKLPHMKKMHQETSVPKKAYKKILGIFKIFLGIFIAGT
jgi:hypothetical protein